MKLLSWEAPVFLVLWIDNVAASGNVGLCYCRKSLQPQCSLIICSIIVFLLG